MRLRCQPAALSLALLGGVALPALAGQIDKSQGGSMGFSKPVASQGCSAGHLLGVTVSACTGFMQGNLLKGGSGDTVSESVAAALASLGMTQASGASYLEKIASNNGSLVVDFSAPLSGTTYLGLHLGGGSNAFTAKMLGGGTAFYRFDAGALLDSFLLSANLTASSGVALFTTGPVPVPQTVPRYDLPKPFSSVPEPQSLALLMAALAAMALARRTRKV